MEKYKKEIGEAYRNWNLHSVGCCFVLRRLGLVQRVSWAFWTVFWTVFNTLRVVMQGVVLILCVIFLPVMSRCFSSCRKILFEDMVVKETQYERTAIPKCLQTFNPLMKELVKQFDRQYCWVVASFQNTIKSDRQHSYIWKRYFWKHNIWAVSDATKTTSNSMDHIELAQISQNATTRCTFLPIFQPWQGGRSPWLHIMGWECIFKYFTAWILSYLFSPPSLSVFRFRLCLYFLF